MIRCLLSLSFFVGSLGWLCWFPKGKDRLNFCSKMTHDSWSSPHNSTSESFWLWNFHWIAEILMIFWRDWNSEKWFSKQIFLRDVTHSWALVGPKCIIWRLCHPPIQCVVMTRTIVSWQTLLINNFVTVCVFVLCESMSFTDSIEDSNASTPFNGGK